MRQGTDLISQDYLERKGEGTDARKVYKVRVTVECQYIPENPGIRLCLSKVQETRKPAARTSSKMAAAVARITLSAALAAPFAAWSAICAFLERGYLAYGGECFFAAMVFLAIYWALGKFISGGGMGTL